MARLLHRLALVLGSVGLGLLALAGLALALRFVQVTWLAGGPEVPHADQKAAYLASLPAVDPARAPNLVVVYFDDLGYGDLASQGNRLIRTPRLDALATEGVRLTQFYAAAPVCTPSRAALLTGRFPVRSETHRHVFFADGPVSTARRLVGWANAIPPDEILLPEVLRAAGYATGMVGKWHLGDRDGSRPNDLGFDSWFGVLWSNDMQPLHVHRDGEIVERDTTERSWRGLRDEDDPRERPAGVDQGTLTARYTDEAIAFLQRHRDGPFFLYLAHTFPHVPHFASAEQAGQSPGGLYGDVVEDLDRSTGRLVEALERLDLSERTLLLVTSDNGPDYDGSPGGLRGRKGDLLEGGQRVPGIVRWPGRVAPGQVQDAPTSQLDLFPTMLGMLGLPLPEDREIDGRDAASAWLDGGPSPHERLYYFAVVGDGTPAAVRDERFKYLAKRRGDYGRAKPQLSDLHADAEAHDLIRLHPQRAAGLRADLEAQAARIRTNPRGWR